MAQQQDPVTVTQTIPPLVLISHLSRCLLSLQKKSVAKSGREAQPLLQGYRIPRSRNRDLNRQIQIRENRSHVSIRNLR